MAASVATVSVLSDNQTWSDGQMMHYLGTVSIGAAPLTYTIGGIVMSLALPLIKSVRVPQKMHVYGQLGYVYAYVNGTDNTNGLLKIFVQDGVSGNPLKEVANGLVIPAGVSGDTIGFEAIFLGQN
jgi:hypothetical protein